MNDLEVVCQVERMWRQNLRLGFTGKVYRVVRVKFYKGFCVRKAYES